MFEAPWRNDCRTGSSSALTVVSCDTRQVKTHTTTQASSSGKSKLQKNTSCKRTPLLPASQPGRPGQLSMPCMPMVHHPVDKGNLICACKADRNRRPARPTGLASGKEKGKSDELCSARPCPCVSISKSRRSPEESRTPPLAAAPSSPSVLSHSTARELCLLAPLGRHASTTRQRGAASLSFRRRHRQQRPVHSTRLAAAGTPAVLAALDDVARTERAFSPGSISYGAARLAGDKGVVWCHTRKLLAATTAWRGEQRNY